MKGTKEIKWTSPRGSEVVLALEYESSFIPSRLIDGGYGGETRESYYAGKTLRLMVNGKDAGTVQEIRKITDGDRKRWDMLNELSKGGATHYTTASNGSGPSTLWGFTNPPVEDIAAAWKAREDEVDDADVKRLKAAEAAAERAAKVREAKEIMNCVGTTKGAFKGRLPTPEEARKWRIRYNNINNEGGDGYIPSIVTDNQVEWAEKVLAEDTASASK